MQVEVGSAISYRSRNYIVISIEKINIEEIAKEDSLSFRTYFQSTENVRCIKFESSIFQVGDIIQRVGERITLECPGVDIQFIWTTIEITRKGDLEEDAQQRVEDELGKSGDHPAQSVGERDPSGEGDGEKNTSEVGGELHGHGPGGEGGDVVHSENGERCESTITIDGGDC